MKRARVFSVSLTINGRVRPQVVGDIFKAWVRARANERRSAFPAVGMKIRCQYGGGKTIFSLDGYTRLEKEEFSEVLSSLGGFLTQAFSR